MKIIHYSGGATGADITWDQVGKKHLNQESIHFYTASCKTPHGNTVIAWKDSVEADPYLEAVNNKYLHRKFPARSGSTNSLLRRNYWQVKDTKTVRAIGGFSKGVLQGGTAWAVYMAIELEVPDIQVYCQQTYKWYRWDYGMQEWKETTNIAIRTNSYAGIGTRVLMDSGKKAIEECIKETKKYRSINDEA